MQLRAENLEGEKIVAAKALFLITGNTDVFIKKIGHKAMIKTSNSFRGNITINGKVGENVTFDLSGKGHITFCNRPPKSVINHIESLQQKKTFTFNIPMAAHSQRSSLRQERDDYPRGSVLRRNNYRDNSSSDGNGERFDNRGRRRDTGDHMYNDYYDDTSSSSSSSSSNSFFSPTRSGKSPLDDYLESTKSYINYFKEK